MKKQKRVGKDIFLRGALPGIGFGLAFGVLLGLVVLDNLGLGIVIGIIVCAALGAVVRSEEE